MAFQRVLVFVGNSDIGVRGQLGLGVGVSDSQTELVERTYFEDLKDPIEFRLPGIDGSHAIPHVGRLGGRILSLVLDLSLDSCHSPEINGAVSAPYKMCTVGWTHIVNCAIASRTG